MWQTTFFDEEFSTGVVNVASVPKLSPFRYPGGKTWFVPYIRRWLDPAVRQKYHFSPITPACFNELDHERLFATMSQVRGDFLMTYENSQEVRDLARLHGLDTRLIPMKNTHHINMMELLIGRDLSWLKSSPEQNI